MTDVMSQYIGGWKRYLSPEVIQRMKKEMRKVPVIQDKEEKYHEYESATAEKTIEAQLKMDNEQWKAKKQTIIENGSQKKENIFQKLVNSIKKYMQNLYKINKKSNG